MGRGEAVAATRRALVPLLIAAIAFIVMAGVCRATHGDLLVWCSNLGSLLLAVGAAAGCARAARRTRGRLRRGWTAMAVACGSWAAGQVVWTVLESALGEATPYPSLADVGYIGFIVAALVAFGLLNPPASRSQHARRWLDGLTVGVAILLVAWLLVLRQVASQYESSAGLVIGLAYPVGDIVLLTVAGLTIAQSHGRPDGWRRLAAGALAMAYSDGAFAYLTATDSYRSGGLPDWGWWAAFCLFGVAGIRVRPPQRPDTAPAPDLRPEINFLPGYATLAAAVLTVVAAYGSGTRLDAPAGVLTVVLVLLALIRQFVGLRENRQLRRAVLARETELYRLAFSDELTGLPNRALFLDRLGHALDLSAHEPHPISVVFCDLNDFKAVNDSLGHAMGDRLLVAVAQRFSAVLRDTDTLARLGSDEFAVFVEQSGGDDRSVDAVAETLRGALAEPFVLLDRSVSVSASIGTATAGPRRTPETAAALLHRADIAMYRARTADPVVAERAGAGEPVTGGTPVVSDADPAGTGAAADVDAAVTPPHGRHRSSAGSDQLAAALADALERRAVRAVYQPVVDTVTGRISALEVLARWTHEGRAIGPDVFVPIAERTGLSSTLTALMLDQACAQLGSWTRQLGHQRLRIAVNVSPTDLLDAELPLRVARQVEQWGLVPEQLALEVTETEMWRPDEVLDVLYALRRSGVRIAIDDFGTGHSSLARLANLPLDTLKIDRVFITDIDHDDARLRFLAGMMDLANHLGLRTIAEGVERPGQLLALRHLRCDLVQGFLTGRPAAPETLTPLILSDATMLPFGLQPSWRSGGANAVGLPATLTRS